MAYPQIMDVPTPLRRSNPLRNRKLENALRRIRSYAALRLAATKKAYKTATRKHYFLPTAYKDLKKAIRQNEDIVLASVGSTLVLVYACSVLSAQFILALTRATYAMSETKGYDMGLALIVMGAGVILFCLLLAALSTNFMSLAIMDGANRKIYRSIRSTLRKSLKFASRITCSWLLLGLVHLVRLLAVLIPLSLYAKYVSTIAVLPVWILIVAAIVGAMWLIAGMLRYSLVPYVALFEPQYLLTESFERSRRLVNIQSKLFIITGSVILGSSLMGLYKLCIYLKVWLGSGANLLFAAGLLGAIIFANGGMVMLYRKRKHGLSKNVSLVQ